MKSGRPVYLNMSDGKKKKLTLNFGGKRLGKRWFGSTVKDMRGFFLKDSVLFEALSKCK